ncbi:MAG TPA: PEP-CTERM sorting domain-containing protein [Phycisphaerae bacterium]|nr:PEP-CTERM sorting domain-containing protein [Phycisphaerae bacterium]
MRNVSYLLGLVALLACASGASAAANSWGDNFDSYADQAAFQAAWPTWSTNGTSMQLIQGFGQSDSQCISGVAPANNQGWNYHNLNSFTDYKPAPGAVVSWQVSFYDTDPTLPLSPNPGRNFFHMRAYGDANGPGMPVNYTDPAPAKGLQGLVALGLYESASTQYGGGPGGRGHYAYRLYYGGLNSWYATAALRTQGWHTMRMDLDADAMQARIWVDGVLDATVPLTDSAKLYAFDGIVAGSGLTSAGYDVAFDDVAVSVTPEPATLLMLAAGGLLLRRRRA